MAHTFRLDPIRPPPECEELRPEVRAFLRDEIRAGTFDTTHGSDSAFNRDFSRRVGERGWISMTWPTAVGGHGRAQLERYVVIEKMLAHRAPTRAHTIADRQSGPVLIKYGIEEVQLAILPRIVAGALAFCIGLSEPRLRRVRGLDAGDADRRWLAYQRPQDRDLGRASGGLHGRVVPHVTRHGGEPAAMSKKAMPACSAWRS